MAAKKTSYKAPAKKTAKPVYKAPAKKTAKPVYKAPAKKTTKPVANTTYNASAAQLLALQKYTDQMNADYQNSLNAAARQRSADLDNERRAASSRIRRQVQAQVDNLNAQKPQLQQQFTDNAKSAYVQNMQSQKELPQELAAQGINNGGLAESSKISLDNQYQNNYNKLNRNYNNSLSDIDNKIAQVRATGSANILQSDNSYANQKSSLMSDITDKIAAVKKENRANLLAQQVKRYNTDYAHSLSEQSAQNAYNRKLNLYKNTTALQKKSGNKKSSSKKSTVKASGQENSQTTAAKEVTDRLAALYRKTEPLTFSDRQQIENLQNQYAKFLCREVALGKMDRYYASKLALKYGMDLKW